jgi:hypothetical protein
LSDTPKGTECVNTLDLKAPPKHREKGEQAMIARLDHHPRLTALLALTTAVLVVVVIALATLLITASPPATYSSESGGANPGAAAAVPGTGANYGKGWNNYGHDMDRPQPAQTGANSAIDRHAEVVAAYHNR